MSIASRHDQDGNCPTCGQRMLLSDNYNACKASLAQADAALASVDGGPSRGLRPLAPEGIDALTAERDKLAAFKAYVHQRLDDAGVPVDPESEHKAHGCRIGGRLDYLLGVLNRWRDRAHDAEKREAVAKSAAPAPSHPEGIADLCRIMRDAPRLTAIEWPNVDLADLARAVLAAGYRRNPDGTSA